jgi:hypothetical protein
LRQATLEEPPLLVGVLLFVWWLKELILILGFAGFEESF